MEIQHTTQRRLEVLIQDTALTVGRGEQYMPPKQPPGSLVSMNINDTMHPCLIACTADRSHAVFPMMIGHTQIGANTVGEPGTIAGLGCWVRSGNAWAPVQAVMWGGSRDFDQMMETLERTPLPRALFLVAKMWQNGLFEHSPGGPISKL